MAYCTNADVTAIVDTDMSTAEIDDLIDRTDVRMDLSINTGALPALFLEDLSATWTAYRVMLKDPDARRLGEYSEDRKGGLEALRKEIDEMFEIGDIAASGVNVIVTYEDLA